MNAVQVMRQRAQGRQSKTTPQQTVTTKILQSSSSRQTPRWFMSPRMIHGWFTGAGHGVAGMVSVSRNLVWRPVSVVRNRFWDWLLRRLRMGLGAWGFDWRNRYPTFNHDRYYSRSTTFYNRNSFYRGGARPGGAARIRGPWKQHTRRIARPFNGNAGRPRIRWTPRPERRPLWRFQRLRAWWRSEELLVTRQCQLGGGGRRRWVVAGRAAAGTGSRAFVMFQATCQI